jgi:predicted nuclease of predicted toxin-antitoxin system
MNISPRTVSFLNLKGYHSKRLNELNLQKASDEEVINFASKEDWVIITIDLDYPEIIAYGPPPSLYKKVRILRYVFK